tara:strand:- start:132 stop:275 length:144 start_codon:yes stop_codon:yes gene_type:complete
MKNLEILPFINIKNLEKEIKDNLFQLNKDELIIIIKQMQSMINKEGE